VCHHQNSTITTTRVLLEVSLKNTRTMISILPVPNVIMIHVDSNRCGDCCTPVSCKTRNSMTKTTTSSKDQSDTFNNNSSLTHVGDDSMKKSSKYSPQHRLRSIRHIMKRKRQEQTMIEAEINTNLELARERILLHDTSCSYQANRIVAVLAMKRILALEKSLDDIKLAIRQLKKLKNRMESNHCLEKKDETRSDDSNHDDTIVSECIRMAIMEQRSKQTKNRSSNDENIVTSSDDDLLHELNRRILRQQLNAVGL
jgi:hypothetical protein